jgi:hypothetical protein
MAVDYVSLYNRVLHEFNGPELAEFEGAPPALLK